MSKTKHKPYQWIDAKCPPTYQNVIALCYSRGWLTPVANITEREMIFMGLTDGP